MYTYFTCKMGILRVITFQYRKFNVLEISIRIIHIFFHYDKKAYSPHGVLIIIQINPKFHVFDRKYIYLIVVYARNFTGSYWNIQDF